MITVIVQMAVMSPEPQHARMANSGVLVATNMSQAGSSATVLATMTSAVMGVMKPQVCVLIDVLRLRLGKLRNTKQR